MILFTLFTKDYFKNEKKNSKVLGKVDSVNPHLADGSVFAAVSLCSGHTAGSGEGNVHTLVSLGRQSPAESFSPPPLPPSLRAELSGALLG